MKTANKIFYSVVLAKLLAIGLFVFAVTSLSKLNTKTNLDNNIAQEAMIDPAKAKPIQTMVMSAKRLSLEEKLAMDLNQARTLQANVQFNKKIRKIA